MIVWLSRWRDNRRRDRVAVAAAVRHFEASTGQRTHPGRCRAIAHDVRGIVVSVGYGQVKPGPQVWYVVGDDGTVVTELAFAEAARFGTRRWRK
jgi:hypothetical protein